MKLEHTAYQVDDPVALAAWYVAHLGLTVMRKQTASPFGHFLADDGHAVMLEFYNHRHVRVPEHRAMDPLVHHIAFRADDVAATRRRLLDAGARAEGDVTTNDTGDTVAMLRDPWGIPLQLVSRVNRMM